jgi:hypothetical protein
VDDDRPRELGVLDPKALDKDARPGARFAPVLVNGPEESVGARTIAWLHPKRGGPLTSHGVRAAPRVPPLCFRGHGSVRQICPVKMAGW